MDQTSIKEIFASHAPTEDQGRRMSIVRAAATVFATEILANTPKSADQTAAIRKVREALFTANASIVLEGKIGL
jgi:hypothetical protein